MTIDPMTVGFWEGDTFVFHEPFDMGAGKKARRVIIGPDALQEGVTKNDAIFAFINGIQDPLPDTDELN